MTNKWIAKGIITKIPEHGWKEIICTDNSIEEFKQPAK